MERKVWARCMGGKFCKHQPGECTADPEYQAMIRKPETHDLTTVAPIDWQARATAAEAREAKLREALQVVVNAPLSGWTIAQAYARKALQENQNVG